MTHVVADRVKEASSTTGAGAFTLAGAVTGFRAFSSVCSIGDTVHYAIEAVGSNYVPSGAWEVGLGTYSGANTLTRTTVLASSNAGAAVDFGAGVKHVWIDFPASEIEDFSALVVLPTTGIAVRTGASSWATRALASLSSALVITNASGVSGNPTLELAGTTLADYGIVDAYTTAESDALFAPIAVPWASITGVDDDLTALAALSGTGIAVRTAADTWATRTIAGTTDRVSVTDGDGISGNPTIDIAATYVGQSSITTLGTITTGTWAASFPGSGGVNSTGEVGVRVAPSTAAALTLGLPSSTATTLLVANWDVTAPATATAALFGSRSTLKTAAAAFTLTKMAHFSALSGTKGAGSTITSVFGFEARNAIAVGTSNYGFYSDIASATNTYQLYMTGTAPSYFGGAIGVLTNTVLSSGILFRIGASSTHPATAASVYATYVDLVAPTTATALHCGHGTVLRTPDSAFTCANVIHYLAASTVRGAASVITVTRGFHASNAIAVASTNVGFSSDIAAASNTYQLYMAGTALNLLKGGTILDTTAAPTVGANQVGLGATVATTVGAAGAASALPATPDGYWIINVAGTQKKVPYYAT